MSLFRPYPLLVTAAIALCSAAQFSSAQSSSAPFSSTQLPKLPRLHLDPVASPISRQSTKALSVEKDGFDIDGLPAGQNLCLKMRVYKLARDGPTTDSMHPAGYSTCSPAVRFQTYAVDGDQ